MLCSDVLSMTLHMYFELGSMSQSVNMYSNGLNGDPCSSGTYAPLPVRVLLLTGTTQVVNCK